MKLSVLLVLWLYLLSGMQASFASILLCASDSALGGEVTIQEFEGCTDITEFSETRYKDDQTTLPRAWRLGFDATVSHPYWRSRMVEGTRIEWLSVDHLKSDLEGPRSFLAYRLLEVEVLAVSSIIDSTGIKERVDVSAGRVERMYRVVEPGQVETLIITCWNVQTREINSGACR